MKWMGCACWTLRSHEFALDPGPWLPEWRHFYTSNPYPRGFQLISTASRTTKPNTFLKHLAILSGVAFANKWGWIKMNFAWNDCTLSSHACCPPLSLDLSLPTVSPSQDLNLTALGASFAISCHISLVAEWRIHFISLFSLNSANIYSGLTYFHYGKAKLSNRRCP